MKQWRFLSMNVFLVLFMWLFTSSAHAARLEVAEDASWVIVWGAALLLYSHIVSGAVGILSGLVASLTRKGGKLHRLAGKWFWYSMMICYVIAAVVAPFMHTEQRTNFIGAILALYLLFTGREAAQRRNFMAGVKEMVGLLVALIVTSMGAYFIWMAQQSPTGTVDGAPPQAFVLFVVTGSLAAIGEIRVLVAGQLSPLARTMRHVWRISMSFFIAAGSLFFGQIAMFPEGFANSIFPMLFGMFPLLVMLIGLLQLLRPVQRLRTFFVRA